MAMSCIRKSNAMEKSSFDETIVPSGRRKKLFVREESQVTSRFWFVAFQQNRFVSPNIFQPRANGSLEKFSEMTAACITHATAMNRKIAERGFIPQRIELYSSPSPRTRATAEKASISDFPLSTSTRT